MRQRRLALLLLLIAPWGCGGSESGKPPGPTTAKGPAPEAPTPIAAPRKTAEDYLKEVNSSPSPATRIAALRRLAEMDARRTLIVAAAHLLEDPDEDARAAARAVLRDMGPKRYGVLCHMFGAHEAEFRGAARAVLDKMGPEVYRVLSNMLEGHDSTDRHDAAAALLAIGPEAKHMIPSLARAYAYDRRMQGSGAEILFIAMLAIDPEIRSWRGVLADAMLANSWSDRNPYVREVDRLLADRPGLAAAYLDLLKDPSAEARAAGAVLIWDSKSDFPGAYEALAALFQDEQPLARWTAAAAICRAKPPAGQAVARLVPLLEDRDPRVRLAAAVSIRKLGGKPKNLVKASASALEEIDLSRTSKLTDEIVAAGLNALGQMGPEASEARDYVHMMQLNLRYAFPPRPDWRPLIEETLKKIRPMP